MELTESGINLYAQYKKMIFTWEETENKLYQQEKELAGPLMQSRVGSSFAPLALSLDELSDYWKKGRAKFLLQMHVNASRLFILERTLKEGVSSFS